MPIKALETRKLRLPVVGKLNTGGEKKPNAPGDDLKLKFRFTSNVSGSVEAFTKLYGKLPTSIPFYFPYDGFYSNFDANNEYHVSGRLAHRCDGEYVLMYKAGDKYVKPPYGKVECPGKCKSTAVVSMIIPDESFLQTFGGVVTIKLKSQNAIPRLYSELKVIHEKFGSLRGIKFEMSRYEAKITTPDGNRITKWLVSIRPVDATVFAALMNAEVSVVSDDYYVDDDGVVVEDDNPVGYEDIVSASDSLPTTKQPAQEKTAAQKAAQWRDALTEAELLAYQGNMAGAFDDIPKYKGNFHAAKGAMGKVFVDGIQCFPVDETFIAGQTRVGIFNALQVYAGLRQDGRETQQALTALHKYSFDGDAHSLLKQPETSE